MHDRKERCRGNISLLLYVSSRVSLDSFYFSVACYFFFFCLCWKFRLFPLFTCSSIVGNFSFLLCMHRSFVLLYFHCSQFTCLPFVILLLRHARIHSNERPLWVGANLYFFDCYVLTLSPFRNQWLSLQKLWQDLHTEVRFDCPSSCPHRRKASHLWDVQKGIVSGKRISKVQPWSSWSCFSSTFPSLFFLGLHSADSSSLARHRRIHTGRRPYRCLVDGCGKSYCRKTTLTKHTRRNHAAVIKSTQARNAAGTGPISISSNSTNLMGSINMLRHFSDTNQVITGTPVSSSRAGIKTDHCELTSNSSPNSLIYPAYSRRSSLDMHSNGGSTISQPLSPLDNHEPSLSHYPVYLDQTNEFQANYYYEAHQDKNISPSIVEPPAPFQYKLEECEVMHGSNKIVATPLGLQQTYQSSFEPIDSINNYGQNTLGQSQHFYNHPNSFTSSHSQPQFMNFLPTANQSSQSSTYQTICNGPHNGWTSSWHRDPKSGNNWNYSQPIRPIIILLFAQITNQTVM